ncbi:hypothetical protein PS1_017165 [Malus domestica]
MGINWLQLRWVVRFNNLTFPRKGQQGCRLWIVSNNRYWFLTLFFLLVISKVGYQLLSGTFWSCLLRRWPLSDLLYS